MTDNRTNAQIVNDAMSVQWGRGGWLAGAVVTALEAAGRLVKPNETKSDQAFCFSEAQVEAAAKAMWELRKRASDPDWEGGELDHGIKEIYRQDARAALGAAQGAAPQAESEHFHIWSELPCKPGQCRMERAPALPSSKMFSVEECPNSEHPGMTICGLCEFKPSSTVDEDAMAEVIREALRDDRLRVAYGAPVNKPQHVVVARAVAEWLKEQGR